MESVYGKRDGNTDKMGPSYQSPENQLPIVKSFFPLNSQEPNGFQKGAEIAKFEIGFFVEFFWLVVSQKRSHSFVVVFGRVDGVEDLPVPVDQGLVVHFRYEIQ